jgi:hypothetical protein
VEVFEWIGDFVNMAYEWLVNAFGSISEYFGVVLEFFEDLPEVIEGFFLLFSWI